MSLYKLCFVLLQDCISPWRKIVIFLPVEMQSCGEASPYPSMILLNKSIELTENAFRFSVYALQNFKNGSKEAKREILNTLGSNYQLKDKILLSEASVWLIAIQKAYPALYAESKRIELENIVDTERRNAICAHFIQRLSATVEDVRTIFKKLASSCLYIPKYNADSEHNRRSSKPT